MQFSSKHMKLCGGECTHQKYCLQARNADSPDVFYQKFCLQHVNPRRRILRKLLVLSIEVYRLLVLSFCHLQQRLLNVTAARFKRINVLRGLKTQRWTLIRPFWTLCQLPALRVTHHASRITHQTSRITHRIVFHQKVLEFHHEIKNGVQQNLRDMHHFISKLHIQNSNNRQPSRVPQTATPTTLASTAKDQYWGVWCQNIQTQTNRTCPSRCL